MVEDEDSFVEALTVGLKREGFRVQVARDGAEALDVFDAVRPDLVLLDVMLPKVSGIDVCRELRRRSNVPIIMVTAKGSEIDTVVGLEVGADDYVTKPYRLRELVARMRAVLRRRAGEAAAPVLGGDALEVGDVALDPERHEVVIRGDAVSLPLKEFELLEILLANAGRVLPRDTLIDRVWGSDYVGDTKTLDVHVKRLRAKVEPDPSAPTRIVTIRGLGLQVRGAQGLTAAGRAAATGPYDGLDVHPGRLGTAQVAQASGRRRRVPPVARSPRLARAARAGGPRATPSSPSRSPTRCSSTSTRTTPGGRCSSTWRSRWRRSPSSRPSSDPPSTARSAAGAG